MSDITLPTLGPQTGRMLTADQFQRPAYENALQDFMRFTGIVRPGEFRTVTRAHIIAWRDDLARRTPP